MAKKPKKKGKARPYNPLAPRFKTQGQFDRAAKKRARNQIAPELGDVNQRIKEGTGAHTTRQGEIGGWYGGETAAATGGFDRLNTALKGILGSTSGMQGDAQAGLSAALRQQSQGAQAEAQKLGVEGTPVDPSFLAATQAYSGANQAGLTGNVAGLLGTAAADIKTSGIRGREAHTQEDSRWRTLLDSLQGERTGIKKRLPGLLEQSIGALTQEELGRAGQSFQQGLATDQFGLAKRAQGETERSNKAQEGLAGKTAAETNRSNVAQEGLRATEIASNAKIAARNARIEKAKLDAAVEKATGTTGEDAAKQAAEGFTNGVATVNEYIKPAKNEIDSEGNRTVDPDTGKEVYKRNWREIFNILTQRNGLSTSAALQILTTYPEFAKDARAAQKRVADRKAKRILDTFPHVQEAPGTKKKGKKKGKKKTK